MNSFSTIIPVLKDVTQIAFWLLAGVLAILSYRQARKSVFQPAKNEVFKVQIAQLQDLLLQINWKSSYDAWVQSGLESSYRITLTHLFESYASDRFQIKIRRDNFDIPKSVGALVSPESKNFILIKGPADSSEEDRSSFPKRPPWESFKWEVFEISDEFQKIEELLDDVVSNPILPSKISMQVTKLRQELYDTAGRAAEDVEASVREFPRHYAHREAFDQASLSWAGNQRKERGEDLFKALLELKRVIREYLQADLLLEEKPARSWLLRRNRRA